MFRTSRFTVPVLPWVAATALLCSIVVPGPNLASAQTAGNLKCKKCVDTVDIDRKAVTRSRIKKGAVSKSRLSKDLQDHVNGRESFYIVLDGNGSTATIATHGPLRYFARCLLNQPDDRPMGAGGFGDRLEIVATSSASGWFEEDASDSNPDDPDPDNVPFGAGEQFIAETHIANPPGSARFDDLAETALDGARVLPEHDLPRAIQDRGV